MRNLLYRIVHKIKTPIVKFNNIFFSKIVPFVR